MEEATKDVLNFIVNPTSGKGRARSAMQKIGRFLNRKRIAFRVFWSQKPGHAEELAANLEAEGVKNIIAVGGDGTFSQTVNGVKNIGEMTFGYIPASFGNDFARTLCISQKPLRAIQHIISGYTQNFDYMQAPKRRAVNHASIGMDIDVLECYNQFKYKSKISYAVALLKTIYNLRSFESAFSINDKPAENKEYLMLALSNGQYFGGGMKFSPHAQVQDGKLNLIVLHNMKRREAFFRRGKLRSGEHINESYVDEYLCERLCLTDEDEITINFDGELHKDRFDICVVKEGLTMFYHKSLIKEKK